MENYTVQTIIDYVNGEDLDNLEELENNYLFMIDVIKYTKDKNMYKLCSFDIKTNFYFVKFLINKFKDDIDFVCLVIDNYLKVNGESKKEKIELLILACDLIGRKNIDKFMEYKIIIEMIYTEDRIDVEATKIVEKDDVDFLNQIGMGFVYFFDKYNDSKIILNFYATKLIEEIFDSNDLEQFVHEKFNTFEELEKKGINNFLLSHIDMYDNFLSDYVSTNIYLLDELKNKLLKIKENWDEYNKQLILNKCDLLVEQLEKYLEKKKLMISIFDILYLFASEFDLKNNYYELGYLEEDDYSSDDIFKTTKEELGIIHYQSIRKMFVEVLNSKKIIETDDYLENDSYNIGGSIRVLKKGN